MHQRPAHFACRVGFVLLCVLPTAAVAGWIVQRSLPAYTLSAKQEWEQELSRQLGLRVTCSSVSYPRPDTAELSSVALADPETGAPIASASTLEVIREADRWKLVGSQVVVESNQWPLLKDQFEQRWLRRADSAAGDQIPCEIWFREITFQAVERSLTLVDVAGVWKAAADGPSCTLTFRLPEADPQAKPAQMTVQRNRQTSPPTTHWQLATGSSAIPCSLVAPAWPMLTQLGSGAEFSGQLDVVQSGEDTGGRLQGTLNRLDLDALVSEQFAQQLSGHAVCQIEDAVLERGRLRLVRGTLKCRDGWIGRSLLTAASEHLQLACPPPDALGSGLAPVSFRQLSLGFELQDDSLRLTGSADPLREHVLIATASGSLLEASPQHRAASWGLLRALAPQSELPVPAARQAQALARLLPAPDNASAATVARRSSHVPTRLQPSRDSQQPPVRQPQLR